LSNRRELTLKRIAFGVVDLVQFASVGNQAFGAIDLISAL
jgi:hypothetical protein